MEAPPELKFGVGVHRLGAAPAAFEGGVRMFAVVRLRE